MKITLITICICFYIFADGSCKGQVREPQSNVDPNPRKSVPRNSNRQVADYEIISAGCSQDQKCLVIAFCDPKLFTQEGMERIAWGLSNEFKDKTVVNVNLFDKRDLAKSYAKGTRSLGDLQNERRGWYLRTKDREFLLFSPNPANQGKLISVKPKRSEN
jgi:hypothetical protein